MPALPEDYLTGQSDIDLQHGRLLSLLTTLETLAGEEQATESFQVTLKTLGKELLEHFFAEEDVLRRSGLPKQKVNQHIAAHDRIVRDYAEVHFHLLESANPALAHSIVRIRAWIVGHVTELDLPIFREIARHDRRGIDH